MYPTPNTSTMATVYMQTFITFNLKVKIEPMREKNDILFRNLKHISYHTHLRYE